MALPPKLARELTELEASAKIEVVEEQDLISLIFKDFPLGPGFNMACCDVLIRIPRSYPDAGPDMFWTVPELTFDDSRIPQGAESVEDHVGKRWRRFSWHRRNWNSVTDNLHGYLEFVRRRLRQKQ
jgi:hypothetical protein